MKTKNRKRILKTIINPVTMIIAFLTIILAILVITTQESIAYISVMLYQKRKEAQKSRRNNAE